MAQPPRCSSSKGKRSRGGCSSCKKMKIKCNEEKPSCEYCVANELECIYLKQPVRSLMRSKCQGKINEEMTIAYNLVTERQLSSVGSQYELILNHSSYQLFLTPFETKLVKFFDDFCVDILSFGVGKKTDDMWRRVAPIYFFKSNLLRQSIFSFSSLVIWHISDTKALTTRRRRDTLGNLARESWDAVCERFEQDTTLNNEMMFINLTRYFLNAVREENASIENLINSNLSVEQKIFMAMELRLSGGLLLAFLGMHSHRLMPLLDGVFKHDFLSICQGVGALREYCVQEFPQHLSNFHWTTLNDRHREVALVTVLKRQVMEYYESQPINVTNSDELQLCLGALQSLEILITSSVQENYPLPIFAWPLMLDSTLVEKMREFEVMPLRLLYAYASLCHFTGFQMDEQKNIWIDYANWFKRLNHDIFGGWKYDFDRGLFGLIETKYRIGIQNMNDLMTLVPS